MPKRKEEWWHTDEAGRRIGWMHPDELNEQLEHIYQNHVTAPRVQFAFDLGLSASTVSRWLSGSEPVPKMVALLVGHMVNEGAPDNLWTDLQGDHLPITTSVSGRRLPLKQSEGEQRGHRKAA